MHHYILYLWFNILAELWDLDWIWVYAPNFMIISGESKHGCPRRRSLEIIAYSWSVSARFGVFLLVSMGLLKDGKVVFSSWALIFSLPWGRDGAVSMLGLSANEVTPHHAVWKLTRTSVASVALLSLLSHAGIIQNREQQKGDSLSPWYL